MCVAKIIIITDYRKQHTKKIAKPYANFGGLHNLRGRFWWNWSADLCFSLSISIALVFVSMAFSLFYYHCLRLPALGGLLETFETGMIWDGIAPLFGKFKHKIILENISLQKKN